VSSRLAPVEWQRQADHLMDCDRLRDPLELARAEVARDEPAADEAQRCRARDHGVGRGAALDARRQVHGVTEHLLLALGAARHAGDEDAGMDADPHGEPDARRREVGVHARDGVDDREPGLQRALGVVLVRVRIPEVHGGTRGA